jgi:hypothetical protein
MKDPEYIQGAERAFQRLALVEQGSIAPKLAEISPDRLRPVAPELLRVRPETSRWIAEFSEHEAD